MSLCTPDCFVFLSQNTLVISDLGMTLPVRHTVRQSVLGHISPGMVAPNEHYQPILEVIHPSIHSSIQWRDNEMLLLLLLLLLLHIVAALPEPSPQRPRALRSGKTNQPVVSPTSQSPPRILTQQMIVTPTGDSEASGKSP